jgi:DNA (cytosine-5)-methyltransferase 1
MRHGSLFSGIGGFDLGFDLAGWECAWQVEQEPFCQAVLKTHWPAVRRFTDVRGVGSHNLEKVDCITAGVPCQDVSVAGKRAGLAGERTGLFYEFARILQELRPAWFVFENVPGLFSSNRGRDFAEILWVLMVQCGYGVSWRVLDSRYFDVAQRRKRVFIVGCFGKPCPAEILFEPESGDRNSAQGRKARADIAIALTSGSGVTGNKPGRRCEDDFNIVQQAISAKWSKGSSGPAGDGHHIAATLNSGGNDGGFRTEPGEHLVCPEVDADRMRDFTGLPEGMDSPRYRALGNAVTATVAEWIGRRLILIAR